MNRRFAFMAMFLVMILGVVSSLNAQTTYGTILGNVEDSSGAVVPNANVTVTNLGTNVSSKVKTSAQGNYVVPNLIPGRYQVIVEASGFKRFLTSNLVLQVDQRLRVDAVLQVGSVTSKVNVTTHAQMVNTDTSTIGTVIQNKQIHDLPLVSRNFMDLTSLSPGVVVDNSGVLGSEESSFRSSLSGGALFIGGGRATSNGYMIDGLEDSDPAFQTPAITPPLDAIQEFKLMSKNYSAEYGGSSSQINIAIKSGTNSLHGTVFDYLRNNALDARNFFTERDPITGRSKAQLRYNQFGFSLGGPIVKNKVFFFGDYQGTRERTYSSVTGRWPSPAELNGNFSADAPIYDPQTGQPFLGNQIPPDRMNAKSKQIITLGLFPTPNVPPQPGFNTVEVLPNPDNIDQMDAKVDANISDKDTFYGRFSYSTQNIGRPGIAFLSGTSYAQKGYNAALSEVHIFSPHLINDIRLGFNRPLSFTQQDGAFGKDLAGSLFTGVNPSPATYGLPSFGFSNYSGVGGDGVTPLDYWTTAYTLFDNATYIAGAQTLNFGADLQDFTFKELNTYTTRGSVSFTGLFTKGPENPGGNAIADFLLGLPFTASVNQGLNTSWFFAQVYSLYAQDDWQITRRLTLNLGIRYSYPTPLKEQQNRISVFNPNYPGGNLLTPNKQIVQQLNSPLLGYTPLRGLVEPDKNDWAPRFGFAFRPFKNNRTVVRGGYGIFYDSSAFNEYIFSVLNPPWAKTFSQTATLSQPINFDSLFPTAPTPAPVAGSISSLSLNPQNRTPYVEQWNFDIERELAPGWLLDLGYEGSKATKLDDRGVPTQGQLMPNGKVVFHYPNFGFILISQMAGKSNYDAFTAQLEKRFSHGFYFQTNYTWSKSLGLTSSECGVGTDACFGQQNYWDRNADYGVNSYDVPHRLVVSGIYELPFGRGKRFGTSMPSGLNKMLGGWQLNSIFQIQSGYPFSIGAVDVSGTNSSAFPRANLVGNPHAPDPVDPTRVFNRYAFAQPAPGTFGNSGRNILRGAGLNNWDISLFKNTSLSERFNLQFRAEFFNAFNHTQFGPFPGNFFSLDPNSSFGVYRSTQHAARIIELALKLSF